MDDEDDCTETLKSYNQKEGNNCYQSLQPFCQDPGAPYGDLGRRQTLIRAGHVSARQT